MAIKNILITGVNGFIGKHLASRLHGKFNIIGFDKKTTFDLEKDCQPFLDTIKDTNLASYYDFSNKDNYHYANTLNGFKNLVKRIPYKVPIVSASSSSTLYISSKLPYIQNKLDTDNFIKNLDVSSSTLLLGGVYSDKCELYMLYSIIERIRNKSPNMIFYPGNANNGIGYIHINQVARCIENSINEVISKEIKDIKIVCQNNSSYKDIYDTTCLVFHNKVYPLIEVPKTIGKIGLTINNIFNSSNFFQPWMIDYCDAEYPFLDSDFADRNLLSDLENILEYAKNYPEHWVEINEKRNMPRLPEV